MEALREHTNKLWDGVQEAIARASRWLLMGGLNEQTEQYAQETYEAMQYPKLLQDDMQHRYNLGVMYKAQANRACIELERLLAMAHIQQARLEAEATKDNWARDALEVGEANIRALTASHDQVLLAARGYHY